MALDRLTQITSSGISSTSAITVSQITGNVNSTGVSTFSSVNVTNLNVTGVTTFAGNIVLGDNTSDDFTVSGEFVSNLIPNITNTYDLGSSTQKWRDVWSAGNLNVAGSITGSSILGVSTAGITSAYINTLSGISTISADSSVYINQNLVFPSGKGIDFSATSNSSGTMTSELLSDYEEGTWTPVLTFGGGSTGITYNVASGNYTKIGNRVTASCVIFLDNKGSSTGNNSISGLPYVVRQAAGGLNFLASGSQYTDRITPCHVLAANDATSFTLTTRPTSSATSVAALTHADWVNSTYVSFTLSYRTD